MPSKITQRQVLYINTYVWNLKKNKTNEQIKQKDREKLVVGNEEVQAMVYKIIKLQR